MSKTALYRKSENLAAETRSQGVFGLRRKTRPRAQRDVEQGLSCGIPSIEQMFKGWFDNGEHVPPERATRLVALPGLG